MINDTESYIADRVAFDLGIRAGLQAAMNLVADRLHFEDDRFKAAHAEFDDETANDAIVRRDFAADIFRHLGEIDPNNLNGRYTKAAIGAVVSNHIEPEFNPYSDLCFEAEEPIRLCEFCGDYEDVAFRLDPYEADVHNDNTPHWICGNCEINHAGEI